MAGKKRQEVREKDVTGLKYFDKLSPMLERLHDVGCDRDKAGNRRLHFDQYCMLILLYLFNPIVTSLRGIQQASELANVQKKLGCPRASLGSLAEVVYLGVKACLVISEVLSPGWWRCGGAYRCPTQCEHRHGLRCRHCGSPWHRPPCLALPRICSKRRSLPRRGTSPSLPTSSFNSPTAGKWVRWM